MIMLQFICISATTSQGLPKCDVRCTLHVWPEYQALNDPEFDVPCRSSAGGDVTCLVTLHDHTILPMCHEICANNR